MRLIQYDRSGLAGLGFRRLSSLQDELGRLFDSTVSAVGGYTPALDIHEDKDKYTVSLEVPGFKREDINVQLEDGELLISGERKSETVGEGTEVHRQERFYGKFSRALALPVAVAADQVKASCKDGVLTVTLPKAEQAKPKQITVSE
jgi:HSP20 family protein